ncbi:hypothetical protein [Planococcus sp. A6]|uniref:hypothetical protein n=1 Tax=Planococcus sp. A6 TaxID=2992760 RepID=UPI003158B1F7
MKTIVTTAYRPTEVTKRRAQETAQFLGLQAVERNKRPIYKLHEELAADVIVCKKERLELYPVGQSEPFLFSSQFSGISLEAAVRKRSAR